MAGSDRENTIRHLVQMMSIRETQEESCEQMDAQLSSFVAQQLQLGERLQLLELVLDQDTRGSWVATKQTTARCTVYTSCMSCIYPPATSMSMLLSIYLSFFISRSKPGHRDSSKRAESAATSAIGSCG